MMRWILFAVTMVYIVAMWYGIIYAIRRGWGPYLRSKREPKVRVHSKVKHKLGQHEFNPTNWQMEAVRKMLVFECEDGVDRTYDVPDHVWDWVEEGDDGVLVYQGHLFADFEARVPRHDLDKAFRNLTRS